MVTESRNPVRPLVVDPQILSSVHVSGVLSLFTVFDRCLRGTAISLTLHGIARVYIESYISREREREREMQYGLCIVCAVCVVSCVMYNMYVYVVCCIESLYIIIRMIY